MGSVGIQRSDSSIAGRSSSPIVADGSQHVGALQKRGEGDAHLLPGGPRSGRQQQHGERVDLGIRETVRLAVLVLDLGLHQNADEIVLWRLASGGHDGRDDLHDFQRLPERFADVESLLDRDAEAAGDGEDRDGRAEVDIELGPPLVLEAVDQEVDRLPRSSS